jgi:hypothetical protein
MIVIISLLNVNIEGLRNCDSVSPSIPNPISKIYSYHNTKCHKQDFGNVPFCKRKSTIKENKELKNKNQDLINQLQYINNTTYNNYFSQNFNHNYTDNLLGLESAIDTYNNTYRIYINNINTYNKQNKINGDMYHNLDKVNKNVQQNMLDNKVNVRKYNILS